MIRHQTPLPNLTQQQKDRLRKHHIAYVSGTEKAECLDGFEEWIENLFEEELSDRTKYYTYGFSCSVGSEPTYQKIFWIEAPTADFLPEEKLFLAHMSWGLKIRYNAEIEFGSPDRKLCRTADIKEKLFVDQHTGNPTKYYEVNMYENGKLRERRPIVGHSIYYAEDCADNWINGVIK